MACEWDDRSIPLGSLLVEHSVSAHAASDRVAPAQADLGVALAADVLHGRAAGGFARGVPRGELVEAAALRGELVRFSLGRHAGKDELVSVQEMSQDARTVVMSCGRRYCGTCAIKYVWCAFCQ